MSQKGCDNKWLENGGRKRLRFGLLMFRSYVFVWVSSLLSFVFLGNKLEVCITYAQCDTAREEKHIVMIIIIMVMMITIAKAKNSLLI